MRGLPLPPDCFCCAVTNRRDSIYRLLGVSRTIDLTNMRVSRGSRDCLRMPMRDRRVVIR
jgi:hypothetical protein